MLLKQSRKCDFNVIFYYHSENPVECCLQSLYWPVGFLPSLLHWSVTSLESQSINQYFAWFHFVSAELSDDLSAMSVVSHTVSFTSNTLQETKGRPAGLLTAAVPQHVPSPQHTFLRSSCFYKSSVDNLSKPAGKWTKK